MCKIATCASVPRARGWCHRHYENWYRYGDPVPQKDKPIWERIMHIGWTVDDRGCWLYNGRINDSGYGIHNHQRVHRISYIHHHGQVADLLVLHTCDTPRCINPDHLVLGTNADNMRHVTERRRHWYHKTTHCKAGHPYDNDDPTPPQDRRCWTCYVEWCRRNKRTPQQTA